MEQENDSLTLYFDSVIENFQNLTEEDKNVLREMEGTPQAEVLRKVLGPEVGSTFQLDAPPSETERMFEGQMQRQDMPEEEGQEPIEDETERMFMAPSPDMRRDLELQRNLEEQPDVPV
jgi:hypothetical protein